MRQCNITKARLPSHFLLPFSTALTPAPIPPQPLEENNTASHSNKIQPTLVPSLASDLPQATTTGSSTYVLNRRDMVAHLTRRNGWSAIVTTRMQDAYARMVGKKNVRVSQEWGWDLAMSDLVLEKLRAEVVSAASKILEGRRRGDFIVPLGRDPDLRFPVGAKVAAVLEIQSSTPPRVVNEEERSVSQTFLALGETPVPVYSLLSLLGGQENVHELRFDPEMLESTHLAVVRHLRTIRLLLALDRLKTYSALRELPSQPKRIISGGQESGAG